MDSTGLDWTNGLNASRRDMKRNFQRVIETQADDVGSAAAAVTGRSLF